MLSYADSLCDPKNLCKSDDQISIQIGAYASSAHQLVDQAPGVDTQADQQAKEIKKELLAHTV
jgi:hypothetical protein